MPHGGAGPFLSLPLELLANDQMPLIKLWLLQDDQVVPSHFVLYATSCWVSPSLTTPGLGPSLRAHWVDMSLAGAVCGQIR